MHVKDRFLKYVSIDTTSNPDSTTCPSTEGQLTLARMLTEEMTEMGLTDVICDENGYVFGTIPASVADYQGTVIGFIAHMDTSDAASGANIRPRIVENYDGGDIVLNEEKQIIMRTGDFSCLEQYKGQDLIVTDGLTLLGGDDKAGVAEILTAAEYLLAHPEIPHGTIRIGFTPDEEIGRGADLFNVEKFGADFAYTVDGGKAGELEYENFNAASAFVDFAGISIHPGSAKNKMINASLLAMEFQNMLPEAQKPEHTEGYEGFIHLDSVKGEVEHASSFYIIRDHDRALFEEKKQLMQRVADYMNQKYGSGTVTLRIEDSYFNMKEQILPHMHLIDSVIKACKNTDVTPEIIPIRGGTDGARLSFMGLPCPNIGVGGHNCHGRFEFVCIQSMEKCVEIIVELAKLYCKEK